jgi:uncharacterized membrane protein YkoI
MKQDRHSTIRSVSASTVRILVAIGLAAAPVAAGAQDKAARRTQELREIRTAVARGQLVPLPRIMAIAQSRVHGDLLKVALEKNRELLIYEVKILAASGQVREVKIDAKTGAVLSVEDD